ncbi:MAG: FMN-dependent NADH-azoreductase [Burkholderiales bacterium PBB1]|nr:MAG: FMN-dependent NADH-azoreductase [Burkholderiales bacterium PBB1]
MPHLLHIQSSPRHQRSASIEVAQAFMGAWTSRHTQATIDTLDVWTTPLPEFDGEALGAKYAALEGTPRSPAQLKAWESIEALGQRFHRADLIVISVPMWNFGIPYRLKHLIDAVSQKDVLFTFDERGLLGLLGGRKAVVVAARGVALGENFPAAEFDHQTSYLTMWARMVGITEVHTVSVEKTLFGPEADTASRAQAKAEAASLAASI